MIELKAIIGARRGRIGDYNSSSIVSHLGVVGKIHEDCGHDTNNDKITNIGCDFVEQGRGQNLYIHANLTDLDEFYRYLSKNKFVIRDSKINVLDDKLEYKIQEK